MEAKIVDLNVLTFGIIGWGEEDITELHSTLVNRKVTTEDMIITRDATNSFAQNMNEILDEAKTEIVYVLCAGIQIIKKDWFVGMFQYMQEHGNTGILYCWNDGHQFNAGNPVYDNPVGTGANLMIRKNLGVRMDEDFVLSQFEDQDFGREMQHRRYRVMFDQRVSVFHPPTDYSAQSLFCQAYSARNHLLLETKWREVGRKDWKGVAWWNKTNANTWRFPSEKDLRSGKDGILKTYIREANEKIMTLGKLELKL